MSQISLLIAGDIVPNGRTKEMFCREEASALFTDLLPYIKESSYNIVNLECPVVSHDASPIVKNGPCLRTSHQTTVTIKKAGFNCITLANNHFRDFGQIGVEDTIQSAQSIGLDLVGGGRNLEESRSVLYKHIEDRMVAIINVCEHEYSISSENYGGSNPIDIIKTSEDIVEAKLKADYVIVIVHGGKEHTQLPTPRMKTWYRHFIKIGADAVVNHHQHCFSGYELYDNKPIFYGLGNFCFDKFELHKRKESIWNYGFCVRLLFDNKIGFELIPYIQCAEKACVKKRDYKEFEKEIYSINEIIADDRLLKDKLREFALKNEKTFLGTFWPIGNRYLRALYNRGLLGRVFDRKGLLNIQNSIECESHLDIKQLLVESLLSR